MAEPNLRQLSAHSTKQLAPHCLPACLQALEEAGVPFNTEEFFFAGVCGGGGCGGGVGGGDLSGAGCAPLQQTSFLLQRVAMLACQALTFSPGSHVSVPCLQAMTLLSA